MTVAALTVLAPLAAAVLALLIRRASAAVALLGAGIGAIAASVTLTRVGGGARFAVALPGLPGLPLRLVTDSLAAVVGCVVALVGLCVFVYAVGYMQGEHGQARFWAGMSFFVAAMQAFVLAGDWLLLLAAWELIGVASYLLIGFWYDRPGVPEAATRAFLTTRAADLGLYLGVFLLVSQAGTTEIAATARVNGAAATIVGLLLLVAAMGKSAQVPFEGWLLDAMAGPTPVSALLHAATLVTAGAVLLTRVSPLLTPTARGAVGIVGGATAVVSGIVALGQPDFKRVLAASTSSQLGFMLLAIGAGSPVAAIFHLVAHAAMKGALFTGAGVFQHAREATAFDALGGVGRAHRGVYLGVALAGLALAGVPPLAGFWSKDAIIAATLAAPAAGVLAPCAFVGTALTGAYIARALRLLWRGAGLDMPVRGQGWMSAGLAILAGFAATLGIVGRSLGALLDAAVPGEVIATGLGVLAAAIGLLAGWYVAVDRLLGPLARPAADGLRVGGGWLTLVVRPALALAALVDRFDSTIDAGVRGVGRAALGVAHAVRALDARGDATVAKVGDVSLRVAGDTDTLDARGIDGLIASLVRGTRALGSHARTLQSGFVSRELALAVAGGVLLIAVLVLLR